MKRAPLREIAQLCARLQSNENSECKMQRAVGDSVRSHQLDSSTLPLILQHLLQAGHWQLALRVVKSDHLDRRNIARDPNLWPLIERGAPCEHSRAAARKVLEAFFAGRCGHRRP
ncbi:hypothetical protein TRVL_03719 [Trypanosoma vivax]|uniref:Uncharacterized protein n=1 Tax=Trypanosoma vivax (strain Y486) TaxID=1055687 RepID=G0TRM3_TRYVY|nr:hypothetical protein TRVL_03719 [Trypanosoma vivax]CCC46593.1 conserved hypothetical protein, unlikely [Trypanosoma vivax Y486]